MSSLTTNLQTIYTVKQQLKTAIGTESDIFQDYPGYVTAAIAAGGEIPAGYTYVSGTYNITANGTGIDIASYESVDVAVPIPAGYIVPSGTITIDDNEIGNNVNVSSYEYAYIDIQGGSGLDWDDVATAGYIIPAGTITIDDYYNNTTVDVTSYAYADIQVIYGNVGSFDYDSFYSDIYFFNEISYSMFDLSNYLQNNPYENSWTSKGMNTVIEGSSYIYNTFDFITLGDIDLTTHFSDMNPDSTGYSEGSYWKIYDAENYEQNASVTTLFDFTNGEQWSHIQYQNPNNSAQYIKFARVPMTWDSMGNQWYPDTSNETEINSMPVVTYDEYGASATHNGTYMFLQDSEYINLYFRWIYGDMGDPDRVEVYSGIGDPINSMPMQWYNIENTNFGKFNFIEYDENNWPPQA